MIRHHLLKLFNNSDAPLSAPELLKALDSLKIRVNKTTVYRELDVLLDKGLIVEFDFGEGKKRYEVAKGHHHHLICQKCKMIKHIDLKELEVGLSQTEKKLTRRSKFIFLNHNLDFFGLCQTCQK